MRQQTGRLSIALVCLALIGGCFKNTSTSAVDCGSGKTVTFDGATYCTYEKGIQVTGFNCPLTLPNKFEYQALLICAEQTTLPEPTQKEIYTIAKEDPNTADTTAPDTADTTTAVCEQQVGVFCLKSLAGGCCGDATDTKEATCQGNQLVCPSGYTLNTECKTGPGLCQTTGTTLEINPATLQFISQPGQVESFVIIGMAKTTPICVLLAWDKSMVKPLCVDAKIPFQQTEPAVMLVQKKVLDSPCSLNDFGAAEQIGQLTNFEGCVDSTKLAENTGNPGLMDLVDLSFEVTSQAFNGTVIVDNRSTVTPQPVNFTMGRLSDIPEDAFVQTSDAFGFPVWLRVKKQGETSYLRLFDGCDTPFCGEPGGGICGQAANVTVSFTGGTNTGSISITWDGQFRRYDSDKDCMVREAAAPGNYVATFCWGYQTEEAQGGGIGTTVKDPFCVDVPFSYPTRSVVHYSDGGG